MQPPACQELSVIRIPSLIALCHHRWAIPVTAEIARRGGCKFVTLVHRLGVGRTALRQTLDALEEAGWVQANPGYGHPLRPEYILTVQGTPIGLFSARTYAALQRLDAMDVGLRKWSLPTIAALGSQVRRFSQIRATLGDVTDRALTQSLKHLVSAALVERRVVEGFPPWTAYSTAARARPLCESLAAV